jgi:hypothetical protein
LWQSNVPLTKATPPLSASAETETSASASENKYRFIVGVDGMHDSIRAKAKSVGNVSTLTALLLLLLQQHGVSETTVAVPLIPAPKKMTQQASDLVLGSVIESQFTICLGDKAPPSDRAAAEWLAERISGEAARMPIHSGPEAQSGKRIVLGSPESNSMIQAASVRAALEAMPAGGYVIRVLESAEGQTILVAGRDREGTWNGTVTLSQLVRRTGDQFLLTRADIDDWPDIPLRGVIQMLDYLLPPSLPHKAYAEGILNYRQVIDRMVEFKLNALIIHVADHIWRTPASMKNWPQTYAGYRGPEFWREKIQEIIAYARSRQVKTYLLLYHTLDGQGAVKTEGADICGMDPQNRAGLLGQFETYTRWFPDLDGYAIHRSEYRRCACAECAKVQPSEEFLQYLTHYAAILKKHSSSATLAFCPFPDTYYPYLVKNKHRLPPDARNYLWASWHKGQAGFLASIKQTQEYSWFDDFAKNWYWIYTNALIDIPLPQAEYFQEIAQFAVSKRGEAITGQFTFGRATDYNSLALAQYTWNAALPIPDFRKRAVKTLWGSPAGVDLVAAERLYQETAEAYVRLHLSADQSGLASKAGPPPAIDVWREPAKRSLEQELAVLQANLSRVDGLLRKAAEATRGIESLRLRGWIHDTRILSLEMQLRREVLASFFRYEAAAGSSQVQTRRLAIAESSRRIQEARRLCLLIEQERAERGMLVVAPLSHASRQTAAVDKLAGIVRVAFKQVQQGGGVPPNRWQDGDLLWRRYLVW